MISGRIQIAFAICRCYCTTFCRGSANRISPRRNRGAACARCRLMGVPIIRPDTPYQNLLVNTGHGHLGWTMAAGSAQLLADLVCGDTSCIDPAPYGLKRFG